MRKCVRNDGSLDCYMRGVSMVRYGNNPYRKTPIVYVDFGNIEFTMHLKCIIFGANWNSILDLESVNVHT